jgi:hypothetical protein
MDSERVRPALAPTGDPRVDAVVQRLAGLEDVDLPERPAVLAEVHDRLREILGELGDPGAPGRAGEQGELSGAFPPRGTQPPAGQPQPRPGVPAPGSWPRRPGA